LGPIREVRCASLHFQPRVSVENRPFERTSGQDFGKPRVAIGVVVQKRSGADRYSSGLPGICSAADLCRMTEQGPAQMTPCRFVGGKVRSCLVSFASAIRRIDRIGQPPAKHPADRLAFELERHSIRRCWRFCVPREIAVTAGSSPKGRSGAGLSHLI